MSKLACRDILHLYKISILMSRSAMRACFGAPFSVSSQCIKCVSIILVGGRSASSEFCSNLPDSETLVILFAGAELWPMVKAAITASLFHFECFCFRWLAGAYFMLVTMLSIGYGDVTPATITEVIVCMFCMIAGIIFFGILLGSIAEALNVSADAHLAKEIFRHQSSASARQIRHLFLYGRLQH